MAPDPNKPGYVPHSESTAARLRDQIEERATAALEPYLQRAIDAQMDTRDDPDEIRATFERAGFTDPDKAIDSLDWHRSAHLCAYAEILTDLMHLATKHNMIWHQAMTIADGQHRDQHVALIRFLVYGAPPEDPPSGKANIVGG